MLLPMKKRMRVDVLFEKAMDTRTQEKATVLLQELVSETMADLNVPQENALKVVRESLGYMAGHYSNETRERVERLFACEHPIFGRIAIKGPPTAEEAFEAGVKLGRSMREKKEAE